MGERREQRLIERSAGKGAMSRAGAPLGAVSYLLEIWQTFHIVHGFGAGPAEEIEGMKEIRLRLLRHTLDTFAFWQDSTTLTLQLEDGRRLEGFLNDDMFIASGQLTSA
jgi:hypothetical protein